MKNRKDKNYQNDLKEIWNNLSVEDQKKFTDTVQKFTVGQLLYDSGISEELYDSIVFHQDLETIKNPGTGKISEKHQKYLKEIWGIE